MKNLVEKKFNRVKDLIGQRFSKLQVIKRVENKNSRMAYWLCKCDCGNETIVRGGHLTTGKIKSCGCLQKQVAGKYEHKKLINSIVELYKMDGIDEE